jgi:hypothetical protein
VAFSQDKSQGHEVTIDAAEDGVHSICFENSLLYGKPKNVAFYIFKDSQDEVKVQDGLTDPLEKELEELKDGLRVVNQEMQYIITRERVHRDTAESTNSRVAWWSISQSVLLVVVCIWQVYYLKSFFEVKRTI